MRIETEEVGAGMQGMNKAQSESGLKSGGSRCLCFCLCRIGICAYLLKVKAAASIWLRWSRVQHVLCSKHLQTQRELSFRTVVKSSLTPSS